MPGTESRVQLAAALLQEAVYRSRESQAAMGGLALPGGNCGLGHKAAVDLDLSPRGRELFAQLWPQGVAHEAMQALSECMAGWVRAQDGLDRKRNHFLKDFRHEHGFDRTRYTPDQRAAFESGLERINSEESAKRELAAAELLNLGG